MIDHSIVTATPVDGPDLLQLENDCFSPVDVFKPGQFRYLLRSKSCRVMVVRGGEKQILAEVIGLLRHFNIPSGRIYKIGVHSDLQAQGIGSRLIRAIEAWFLTSGMLEARAEIRESNRRSLTLFERNGYSPLKKLPRYYADGEDGIKLSKILVPHTGR